MVLGTGSGSAASAFITGCSAGPGGTTRPGAGSRPERTRPGWSLVDELTIIIAPVTLGAGKRLFDGFGESLELEHLGVRQSPLATFIDYRVQK